MDIVLPDESLKLQSVIASAMSRHTFTIVHPSKRGVENQEQATSVGVKWKKHYILVTAAHVLEAFDETMLRFFLPADDVRVVPSMENEVMALRTLKELCSPRPPILAEDDDLAAIVLPPQPDRMESFFQLDEESLMPPDGKQVSVFGYPGAVKKQFKKNFIAGSEYFASPLKLGNSACSHPPALDFTVAYESDQSAGGFSGSGLWWFPDEPFWVPEPQLKGIITLECQTDKVLAGYRIETVIRFLKDKQNLFPR